MAVRGGALDREKKYAPGTYNNEIRRMDGIKPNIIVTHTIRLN